MSDLPVRDAFNTVIYPRKNTTGLVTTPSLPVPGNSEAAGTIAEMQTAVLEDFILTHLCGFMQIQAATTATLSDGVKIELLSGPSGAEQPLGAIWLCGTTFVSPAVGTKVAIGNSQPCRPMLIKAGTRLSVQARKQSTNTLALAVYAQGIKVCAWSDVVRANRYEEYLRGQAGLLGRQALYPIEAGAAVVSGTSNFTAPGASAEIIANALNEMWVEGVMVDQTNTIGQPQFVLDVGIGPSGGEIWQSSVALASRGSAFIPGTGPHYFPLPVYVAPGERVAVRLAGFSASVTLNVHLIARELN